MSTITHFDSSAVDFLNEGAAVTGTVVDPANAAVSLTLFASVNGTVTATKLQKFNGQDSVKFAAAATNCSAATAAATLISSYTKVVQACYYRPESMAFSAGDQHTIIYNSTNFDVIVNHTGGIKARARVIDGANAMVVQTAQSAVLNNNQWYRVVVIYTKIDATHGSVDLLIDDVLIGTSGSGVHTPPGATLACRYGSAAASGGSGTITAGVFYLDKVSFASMNAVTDRPADLAFPVQELSI